MLFFPIFLFFLIHSSNLKGLEALFFKCWKTTASSDTDIILLAMNLAALENISHSPT